MRISISRWLYGQNKIIVLFLHLTQSHLPSHMPNSLFQPGTFPTCWSDWNCGCAAYFSFNTFKRHHITPWNHSSETETDSADYQHKKNHKQLKGPEILNNKQSKRRKLYLIGLKQQMRRQWYCFQYQTIGGEGFLYFSFPLFLILYFSHFPLIVDFFSLQTIPMLPIL